MHVCNCSDCPWENMSLTKKELAQREILDVVKKMIETRAGEVYGLNHEYEEALKFCLHQIDVVAQSMSPG